MDNAEAALIITRDLVNMGYTPEQAVGAMNAVADGTFQTAEDYFAANNIKPNPKAPASKGAAPDAQNVSLDFTRLNLKYAYDALREKGQTNQEATEWIETMVMLAGDDRDARTYIDDGAHPREKLNVGAARLPNIHAR